MVKRYNVGYANPKYSLNSIYFYYLKTLFKPEGASPVRKMEFLESKSTWNFPMPMVAFVYCYAIEKYYKMSDKPDTAQFFDLLLRDIIQICQPSAPKCLVAISQAILEHRYLLHLKEANLINRKSVKIYLYCLDSQKYWKCLTLLMPMASAGANNRIYGNRLSMKMMNIALP